MKYLLTLLALISGLCYPEKTTAQTINLGGHTTRAVVIGISDYREPLIPDLRFADRDARAFADWLRSPEGLALPDSSIRFLANQQATTAQMIVNLDWLIEASKPGDRAFIYFSGHGDVERVTKFNLGYLLSYDSPPAVYGAGAFSLQYLQAILSTLSENDVQVFIITDACRAGKLAGNSVSGTQVTATQLSQQFANEIKVLSCQPDEFSLEGEQWGGGRGCFSYHLEDALYGFADADHDASVDLLELRRYLEDHVSREAAPQSQVPMVSGPVKTKIAAVREGEVAARKAAKGNRPVPFLAIENKGMESRLLEKMDSIDRRLYAQFLVAIDSGHLMSPLGKSANDYFKLLIEKPEMAALHGTMKRKLAAALMDEGQAIINKVLQTDPQMVDNIWANKISYDHLPAYFHRAAEILGKEHYTFKDLKVKELYFQSKTIRKVNYPDSTAKWRSDERTRLLESAIALDSEFVIGLLELGKVDLKNKWKHLLNAAEKAPNWCLLQYELGLHYGNAWDLQKTIAHFKMAIAIDSSFLPPYSEMSFPYEELGQQDSAIFWRKLYIEKYQKKVRQDSASITALECNGIGFALWRLREFEKAKSYLLWGEKLSNGKAIPVQGLLTLVLVDLLEFENAVEKYDKIVQVAGGFQDEPGNIYFNFLNDTTNAILSWAKSGDNAGLCQIQAWHTMENYEKANRLGKMNLGKPGDYHHTVIKYYIAESARLMQQNDTAAYYYRKIIEDADIGFKLFYISTPDFLLAALAHFRLGNVQASQQLIDSAEIFNPNEPSLHFYLACFFAQTNNEDAAISALKKAIALGWQPAPLDWVENTLCDPLLNPIRESEGYKAIVRQHFPKYYDIATRIPGKH